MTRRTTSSTILPAVTAWVQVEMARAYERGEDNPSIHITKDGDVYTATLTTFESEEADGE